MTFYAVALALPPLVALGLLARRYGLLLASLVLLVGYWAITEALSRPKPARLALLERVESDIPLIAFTYTEGEAIFLWLQMEDGPRAYRLPWSQEDAEQMTQAMGRAEAEGTGVMIRSPFNRTPGEPLGHVPPVQADPPKQ